MPASRKPTPNRNASSSSSRPVASNRQAFKAAPSKAQARKTRCGANRSASISSANTSVPATKPSCTTEVSRPTAEAGSRQARCRSGITALTANHSDVPANCESTITGRMRRGTAMLIDPAYRGTAALAAAGPST